MDLEVLKVKHQALSDRVDRLEQEINDHLDRIEQKLDRVLNRPSWLTVWVISFLASGFLTMLGLILTGKH